MNSQCHSMRGLLQICAFSVAMTYVSACAGEAAPKASLAQVNKPDRVVLLDIVHAGKRLVAVGERGVVFSSDAEGQSWQGQRSPVTRTLTAVAFADEKVGVAVGHGGSLLRTQDGGASWTVVKVEDAGNDSLLGVTVLDARRFIAYGAFGIYLESTDQGVSWRRQQVINPDFDRHISKVFSLDGKLLLAGESGTLAESADGREWTMLASPYAGSWFGGMRTRSGAGLIYGMRGNLFRSEDDGKSWLKVELNTKQGIMNALQLPDGSVVLMGNAGFIARSDDDGRSFRKIDSGSGGSFAQAVALASGELLAVGDRGVVRIKMAK